MKLKRNIGKIRKQINEKKMENEKFENLLYIMSTK